MFWVVSLLQSACFVSFVICLYALIAGPLLVLSRRKQRPIACPGVSILRPLKGIDINLEASLTSSFLQEYPLFEILFAVQRPDDPCIPLVKELQARYAYVPSTLIIGESPGQNPKVANLLRAYEAAKYDILWVMDSNVQISNTALGSAVAIFEDRSVGLVHHVPVAAHMYSFGAVLDGLYLNTEHARVYSAGNFLGIASMVIGKSNLYKKSTIEAVGGLAQYTKYMAEDNKIAQDIMELGFRHQIAPELAYQSIGSISISDYLQRRIRWIRIRKYNVPAPTLYEPFSESVVHSLLSAFTIASYFNLDPWTYFWLSMSIWFVSDTIILCAAYNTKFHQPKDLAIMLLLWPLRESMNLFVWIGGITGSKVLWRGSYYRCNADGTGKFVGVKND